MHSVSIQHALGLHLYQPPGNLRHLLAQDEAEAGRILRCYERVARHAHKYAGVARLHVAVSVVLLEQLRDPELIDACRHLADLPAILEGLRTAAGIEFVGTGYRHAPLPLIPRDDWDEQLRNERVIVETLLGRVLKGYWPPASLFVPAMIPALVRAGYAYVLLPAAQLARPDGAEADPYRVYRLSHEGARITAVPLDRGFSQAQESGLDAPWFADEVRNGVAHSAASAAPHLLTTWSDGENGEWFRRLDEEHGFFGQFFAPYMEFCETGEFPVEPVHLSEYLAAHRPEVEAVVRTEASPEAVSASPEGEAERLARQRLVRSSARYWELARAATPPPHARTALPRARELILAAEDSGFLFGGADRRAAMLGLLDEADRLLDPVPLRPTPPAPAVNPAQAPVAVPTKAPTTPPVPAPTAIPARAPTPPVRAPVPSPQRAVDERPPEPDAAPKGPDPKAAKGPSGRPARRKGGKRRR